MISAMAQSTPDQKYITVSYQCLHDSPFKLEPIQKNAGKIPYRTVHTEHLEFHLTN